MEPLKRAVIECRKRQDIVDRIESEVREQLNRNQNESDIIAKG